MQICREFLKNKIRCKDVLELIEKYILPIRDGKDHPRIKAPRREIYFNYRLAWAVWIDTFFGQFLNCQLCCALWYNDHLYTVKRFSAKFTFCSSFFLSLMVLIHRTSLFWVNIFLHLHYNSFSSCCPYFCAFLKCLFIVYKINSFKNIFIIFIPFLHNLYYPAFSLTMIEARFCIISAAFSAVYSPLKNLLTSSSIITYNSV